MERKPEKQKNRMINTTTIGMAQNELIQKNGEGAGQIIQGLKGVRYDKAGSDLNHQGRNLKDISNYKVNPDYEAQNIKQQSGFSAELIKEARDNKEAIISGDTTRTRTTDGIGRSNDQQYDHVKVDQNGNVIKGSEAQMKFLQVDGKGRVTVVDNIVNDAKWDRYDGYIDIPEDQYDAAIKYAEDKGQELQKQANELREKGNIAKSNELEEKARKYEESKKKLRKSNVKESDAIDARINPDKFVRKEVLKDCHNAGIEAAKGAIILGGGISCAQNLYSVIYQEKPMDEAIIDVAKTTAKSGITAYGVGVSGTAIKSIMHTSKNEVLRKISTTNAPVMIATATVQIGQSLRRYAKEEIDTVELLEELGEKGTGMVAAGIGTAFGSTVGSFILPGGGTIVGGFVGSMIGYTISNILYKSTLDIFKNEKISAERRRIMEELSAACVDEMVKYQQTLTEYASSEFHRREDTFNELFNGIYDSIIDDNINGFFENINGIGKEFGIKAGFQTFEEFEKAMDDEEFVFTF